MRGNKQLLTILVSGLVGVVIGFVVGGLIFGFAGGGLLGAGVTSGGGSQPTYASAVVDGNYFSDWNLSTDFFSDLYRAANTSKPIEAKLYLRYDCGTGTMYALVLSVDGREVDTTSGESWIAIDTMDNKVSFSAFEFVYSGSTAVGWEASFPIGAGTYQLWAHTNVYNGEWQTAKSLYPPVTIECYEPTAVFLNYFKADSAGTGGVMLSWQTASETNNLGFNVYRGASPAGPWTQMNPSLIPSQSPGGMGGANYTWLDPQGNIRLYYLLEDVDMNGTVTQHGPVRVTSAGFFGGTIKP